MAALFILGSLVYSNTLYSPFIFDDAVYIVENYEIRDLSKFLKNFYGTRYIGLLSFAINYYFGGLNPFGYHLVNIIIHIINAMLVYYLVSLTFAALSLRGALAPKSCPEQGEETREIASVLSRNDIAPNLIAFSVSLIFLVHPIQTQAVSYITQRFTSLAAFFYLLALVLYVKYRLKTQGVVADLGLHNDTMPTKVGYYSLYVLSILSAILAMKTKEISFTLPFIIALYEWTFFSNGSQARTRLLYLIPFFLTLLIIPLNLFIKYINVPYGLEKAQLADIASISKYDYLLTQFNVVVTYIRLLFLPINQNFDYDYPIAHSIFEPRTFLSFLFLLSIFGFAVYLYIRSRKTHNIHGILTSFGIFWFFITLSVESSIIPIRDVIFEHRLYLPSIGAIIAFNTGLLHGIEYARARLSIKTRAIVISLSLILVFAAIFSAAAYKRNLVWKDLMTMALDMLKKSPNKPPVLENIGGVYFMSGRLDEAEEKFKKAIDLQSEPYIAYNALGRVYLKKGLIEDAEMVFKKAVEIKIEHPDAHENLGDIYLEKALWEDALREYETALLIKESPKLFNKIGALYLKLGDRDTAVKAFKEAIRLEPDFLTAYVNMGFAYFDKGLLDDAETAFRKALGIMPGFANAHYGLGEAYDKKGMNDKAVEHYKEYIKYADPKEKWVERAKKRISELEAR